MTDSRVQRLGLGRRAFLYAGVAGAGLLMPSGISGEQRSGGRSEANKDQGEEVAPPEDLMREHGVLKRVMLVYEEAIRRIEARQDLPPDALRSAANIIRTFIEDYHERLEEDYLFPRFEKAGRLTDLTRVLRAQHQAGRRLTEEITQLAPMPAIRNPGSAAKLSDAMRQFVRMYNPHEAREDTVLFPALRQIVPRQEFGALGEDFEKKEHALFGEEGFEKIVESSCLDRENARHLRTGAIHTEIRAPDPNCFPRSGVYDRKTMTAQRTIALAAVALMAACGRTERQAFPPDADAANASVLAWRAKHESDYRREWVTIAGLHALKPGINTAGSATTNDIVLPPSTPSVLGKFVRDGERVSFEPAAGAGVLLKDKPVKAAIDLRDDGRRDVDELVVGAVRLVVHVSGGNRSIRVRDPNGPLARGFVGFAWFPIDAQYRVRARLIRDSEPRRLKVLNTYGDVDEYSTEGIVEFTLHGQTLRLRPFTTRPKRFYFVFRDASSGHETYDTARFLYSDLQDDGTTMLDFNEAYNPPCAFNPYTTCPIPLKENRLPVKILAGEKAYAGRAE